MAEPKFNIEGATNGLVLTLFVASAIFLGIMLLYVLRDIRDRVETNDDASAARTTVERVVPARA